MDVDGTDVLPNELWCEIFSFLPSRDVFFSCAHTCQKFRNLIRNNTKRLPLIRTHCHVSVTNMDYCEERYDGRDPMIQYTFTAFDPGLPDYSNKRRSCMRGNDLNSRALFVSHYRSGELIGELGSQLDKPYKSEKIDAETAVSLLSYMCVEAMRFDVLKQGRKLVNRLVDERFAHGVQFCEERCGRVNMRSLFLNSQNPHFAWSLGPKSIHRLLNTTVESLTVENMHTLEVFNGKTHIPLSRLRTLRLKLDARHKSEIDNNLWLEIDGDFLLSLPSFAVRNLELNLFSDVGSAITGINANHMCEFIKSWRRLLHPWHIKNISFNTTTTISEFRTAASQKQLFVHHHLVDIPYCRFRTHHPSDPNVLLELACYGNGSATQWTIRSGYPSLTVRTR